MRALYQCHRPTDNGFPKWRLDFDQPNNSLFSGTTLTKLRRGNMKAFARIKYLKRKREFMPLYFRISKFFNNFNYSPSLFQLCYFLLCIWYLWTFALHFEILNYLTSFAVNSKNFHSGIGVSGLELIEAFMKFIKCFFMTSAYLGQNTGFKKKILYSLNQSACFWYAACSSNLLVLDMMYENNMVKS